MAVRGDRHVKCPGERGGWLYLLVHVIGIHTHEENLMTHPKFLSMGRSGHIHVRPISPVFTMKALETAPRKIGLVYPLGLGCSGGLFRAQPY